MSFNVISFLKSALANRGAVPVADDNPLPVYMATPSGIAAIGGQYETVAAGQTTQALGATGAAGDYLSHVIITPATTSPGVVTIIDNATTIIPWLGGTVGADLKPFVIDVRAYSVSGAWKITTGSNVSVVAVGRFT